ncbi:MAG: S9 family peptidase [Betaproteobacteria bacterium]
MSSSPPLPHATQPPTALRLPHTTAVHDRTLTDDYYWLRDRDDPRVRAYLEAENAYTAAVMRPIEAFQQTLYAEMLARIKETDMGVPYRYGAYMYYSRTEAGRDYPIYCRRGLESGAAEQIILDMNALAKGHPFFSLGAFSVSPDANLLAYSTDVTGFRVFTLQIKDLRTGELLPERIEHARSIAWANDSATLFYAAEDDAKRASRLYRHRVGHSDDKLIFEEQDGRFSVGIRRSRSRGFLFLGVHSATTSEVYAIPADQPEAAPRMVAPRTPEHEYSVDHRGDLFYIVTNDRGRNGRLVTAPVADAGQSNWTELIGHREDVMLEDVDLFSQHWLAHERAGGFPRIRVMRFDTGEAHTIEFPEPAYSVSSGGNFEFDTQTFRFAYQSLVTPSSVFDYDMLTRQRTLLKQEQVLGGYDPARYASELSYAQASDGTKVPVSLVYKRDMLASGAQPLLLTGYGAYGFPSDVHFSSSRLSLLDRGVVYAIAHIRGGGEMGKKWHDQGRMLAKRNTFTDFTATAEHLIADGWTDPAHLVIEGGSAGGLLMGAVANLRPDLFRAVVSEVPFLDVINTMLDASLPLTTGEYEEWGNPNDREYFDYMLSYSPYDNLAPRAYPAMLVETSLNDSQVMYWEPAKYVAKLRTLKTDANPVLLKINMEAGHGGASGRYDYLHEIAFTYTFMLWQMGLLR